MRGRRLGRLLGCSALALLLAGCFKVNMDVEVTPENTVSGSAVIAVDESLLRLSGQNVDQLFEDMDLSELPPGTTTAPYSEDGFVGQEITFSEMTLDAFTADSGLSDTGTGEDLNIVRRGDEFHVTGALDMTGEEFTGAEIPQEFMERFEFRISITFPGDVKSSSGEVDGNTVTWEPKIGQNTRVDAVASAIPSGSPMLMIALIALGALVLGAIAFLLTHRKSAVASAGPTDLGFSSPVGDTPAAMPEGPVGSVPPVEPPSAGPPPGSDEAPHEGWTPPPPPPTGTP